MADERRRLYSVWSGMRSRCNNPENKAFHRYGGRGITICERWASFENFASDMGPRPEGMSIDRIDNDKGYYPENCRWATPTQQARNKSDNRLLTWNGLTKCLADWAEDFGITRELLSDRLRHGWSMEAALTTLKEAILLVERCRNGHVRTPENTYTGFGCRMCRECNRIAVARYAAKQRAFMKEQQ